LLEWLSVLHPSVEEAASMMSEYSAAHVPHAERAGYWSQSVTATLFPLSADIREPSRFNGRLRRWDLATTSLSHFLTEGVRYRRERHHLKRIVDEDLLITFALRSGTEFSQGGVSLACKKDQFIVQRGSLPYQFGHADANELLVLKVRSSDLTRHVRSIDRFSTCAFDGGRGIGRLLLDTLRSLPRHLSQSDPRMHARLGSHVVELVGLALEGDERVIASGETTVKRAHLARIERFIRQHLRERGLAPEVIAAGCGISVRYLHDLFSGDGLTIGRWIRQLRLNAAHEQLSDPARRETIAEIAYRWGFSDQAQFSRHFRAQFGVTAREVRGRAVLGGPDGSGPAGTETLHRLPRHE
jgi:AraC-like DNA-binding protein